MIPGKKTRGKKMPLEQKRHNSFIASCRMVVEHAICGIKRIGSASNCYRNRRGQDDKMFFIAAALWNFHLQYR